jgi:hypothetical protein
VRFDALVEAARRVLWGTQWAESPGFRNYCQHRQLRIHYYQRPVKLS